MPTATGYSLQLGGKAGNPVGNPAGWNTIITHQSSVAFETPGVLRWEGANCYIYAQQGTASIASGGYAVKLCTSSADSSGNVSPVTFTALGATAAGYFSAHAITIQTCNTGGFGWYMVRGYATLPLNSNTAGLAFGTPLAPSSSSAGWAECAAASSLGRANEPNGATLGTATQTAAGGQYAFVNMLRSFY